ncbi:MAG: lauroyl-Kdo(2)-lipid IV(A) myristoyltransferase [Gammaproteobacteria bacterium]|nr:lauroyl-Kdo(2)-lipid IV(A) myristoyltransferase [Gammaproteobacteria bacterium]
MSSLDKYIFRQPFEWAWLHPKYWSTWFIIGLVSFFAFVPPRIRDWFAVKLAALVFKFAKKPVRIVNANLKLCFHHLDQAQRDDLIRQNIEIAMICLLAQGELVFRSKAYIRNRAEVHGWERYQNIIDQGKIAIFIAPHFWGLEFNGVSLLARGVPLVTMANRHKNPMYNWMSMKQRSRFCDRVYVREGGLRVMIKGAKEGKSLFYLPDEDHGPEKSELAPFFDTTKAALPVLSRIAKATNGVIVPLYIAYDRTAHKFNLTIEEPLDCTAGCSKEAEALFLNKLVEDMISKDISQYMWMLRIFKTRPPGEDSPY